VHQVGHYPEFRPIFRLSKVKVNQSHYRPGQAHSVPGGWGSEIWRQSAHGGGKVVSITHRPHLPHRKFLVLISVKGWDDLRVIVQPEGLGQWKIPVRPSGIEPLTLRIVAQCLNQLRYRVPPLFSDTIPQFNLTSGRKPRNFSVSTACNWPEFRPRTFQIESLARADITLWTITAILPT
jgi:hypothetical protein